MERVMPLPSNPKWTDLWILAGDMINCSECRAPQFMQQRDRDFVHTAECSRAGPDQQPYMQLLEILKKQQHPQR